MAKSGPTIGRRSVLGAAGLLMAQPALAEMAMLRQGRLSVSPVTDAQWATILKMADS